jgi:uncharacterized protein
MSKATEIADKIQEIECFVVRTMGEVQNPDLRIAHDFKHVDRVRRWALHIAKDEGYPDLALIEAAALLHDIGLAYVSERSDHGRVGAEVAARFLHERQIFAESEVDAITEAIRCHNAPPGGGGTLGTILREADTLDALGAVGIMRALTSKYYKSEYDPAKVKGETWGLAIGDFEHRFAAGKGVGPTIADQINMQISLYGNLRTEAARQIAEPLVAYMRAYLEQLDHEITGSPHCIKVQLVP